MLSSGINKLFPRSRVVERLVAFSFNWLCRVECNTRLKSARDTVESNALVYPQVLSVWVSIYFAVRSSETPSPNCARQSTSDDISSASRSYSVSMTRRVVIKRGDHRRNASDMCCLQRRRIMIIKHQSLTIVKSPRLRNALKNIEPARLVMQNIRIVEQHRASPRQFDTCWWQKSSEICFSTPCKDDKQES